MSLMGLSRALCIAEDRMDSKFVEMRSIMVLLKVAQSNQTPMSEIGAAVGLSQAAVSRNVGKLGDGLFKEINGEKTWIPGLKLVESFEDPNCRRRSFVRLTAKGQHLVTDMLAAVRQCD